LDLFGDWVAHGEGGGLAIEEEEDGAVEEVWAARDGAACGAGGDGPIKPRSSGRIDRLLGHDGNFTATEAKALATSERGVDGNENLTGGGERVGMRRYDGGGKNGVSGAKVLMLLGTPAMSSMQILFRG